MGKMFDHEVQAEGVPLEDLTNLNILMGKRVRVYSNMSGNWRLDWLSREMLAKLFGRDRDVTKIEMV